MAEKWRKGDTLGWGREWEEALVFQAGQFLLGDRPLAPFPRPHGFYVSCLPVKIQGASAGWCRAVALVPEG